MVKNNDIKSFYVKQQATEPCSSAALDLDNNLDEMSFEDLERLAQQAQQEIAVARAKMTAQIKTALNYRNLALP